MRYAPGGVGNDVVTFRALQVGAWVLFMGACAGGCTTLLDIDGAYAERQGGSGGSSIEVPDSGGGSGSGSTGGASGSGGGSDASTGDAGQLASGGVGGDNGTGGISASGGAPGLDGGPSDGGPVGISDVASCPVGEFTGTFLGMHSASITVVGAKFNVAGAVRFRLRPRDDTQRRLAVADGVFDGEMSFLPGQGPGPAVPFSATMIGGYDCATAKLSGQLVDGKFTDPNASQAIFPFEGTYGATLVGDEFSGVWYEQEVNSIGVYPGSGTFSAKRDLP